MLVQQRSFFEMLKQENFSRFSITYDRKADSLHYDMAQEWSTKVKWAGKDTKGLLKRSKKKEHSEVLSVVEKYKLNEYLNEISSIIKDGLHERLDLYFDPQTDTKCIMAFHNTKAEYLVGGIRRVAKARSEEKVLIDTLCLAKGTTYRCAVGKMPCGGVTLCVYSASPGSDIAKSFFGFLAYIIEKAKVVVGPESGFSKKEIQHLRKYTSRCVLQEKDKKNAISTAGMYSVYTTIKQSLKFRYGNDSLSGKTVGIQGMGSIGSSLAEKLLSEGADLMIADIDKAKVDAFVERAGASAITVVESSEIGMQMGHVFAPCAFSRVLNRDTIRYIDYHMIVGGANNLLDAALYEDELTLAKRLFKKDIIYVPDWISNVGAVMYGVSLYTDKEDFSLETKQQEIEEICTPLLEEIFTKSKQDSLSPLEVAYKKFESIIYN